MSRRGAGGDGPSGLAVVDKPAGWTSHDVVARCRRLLETRKVGHAGTLDPDATGVLLVGVGAVTRLMRYLSGVGKSYTGEVVLGTATSTLDASGEVTASFDMGAVRPADVAAAAARFVGDIEQVPPMVSAVKVGGRRLHELAREGVEVERAARPVTVTRFDVTPTADPLVYAVTVDCSSGTYIRTLAADLGATLGGGAHLRNLRRTAVGPFDLGAAVPLDAVAPERLLTPAAALPHLGSVPVTEAEAADLRLGRRPVPAAPLPEGPAPWRALDPAGDLVAIVVARGSALQPEVVLPAAHAPAV
jgi:tRNA pseudouridine55 synthase